MYKNIFVMMVLCMYFEIIFIEKIQCHSKELPFQELFHVDIGFVIYESTILFTEYKDRVIQILH